MIRHMGHAKKRETENIAAGYPDLELSNFIGAEHQAQAARLMARQQLALSSDSPFNLDDSISYNHADRARLLQEETNEIKKQLDLVRSRLNDFNQAKQISAGSVDQASSDERQEAGMEVVSKCEERKHFELNQQATSSDSQFHSANRTINAEGPPGNQLNTERTRTRPLTGRADCPNCECDKGRKSICDNCASFQQAVVRLAGAETRSRRPSFITGQQQETNEPLTSSRETEPKTTSQIDYDERPIRPARGNIDTLNKRDQTHNQPVHVHREVVPNQVFSIGKSLNEKRVQLTKAVEELQLMMDKVKKRGERLDQERKVAQLYKEQWRFGPTIGGGGGGPRAQSGKYRPAARLNYQSRLDPRLTRDTHSLMGFQQVEPSMKLRQFGSSNGSLNARQPCRTPQPKPRLSKMGKMPSLSYQNAISNRLAERKEPSDHRHHVRSKSLDSLHAVDRIVITGQQASLAAKSLVINHKEDERKTSAPRESSGSQVNLDRDARGPEEEIEEELDDGLAIGESRHTEHDEKQSDENDKGGPSERQQSVASSKSDQTAVKTSWVPVFGETEIKTVDRRQPSRKTAVLSGQTPEPHQRPPGSILRQQNPGNLSRGSAMKHRSYSALGASSCNGYGDSIMNEATKKLKFATNLLEREKRDSCSKNQLIVCNRLPVPATHADRCRSESRVKNSFRSSPDQINRSTRDKRMSAASATRMLTSDASQEIERLQAKIDQQQRVLSKLRNQSGSCCCSQARITRLSSSPSRQTRSKSAASNPSRSADPTKPANELAHKTKHKIVAHLKEQLSKTKARLSKMLEEERAKHEQLEKRVHSTLRRQTDLQSENEILRQSLNRCIDTCLRDISATFESLSESIIDSTFFNGFEAFFQQDPSHHENGELIDVAQLLDNNRHLRQLRSHIETIESQRRSLFEELSNAKLKSKQLELQLIEGKLERDQLMEANKRLERKLLEFTNDAHNGPASNRTEPESCTSKGQNALSANTNSLSEMSDASQQQSQADLSDKTTNGSDEHCTSTTSTTFDSIDIYRQYIQSMTPDLESIRRERRMILDEFDNIKKMLANMNE